MSYSGDPSFSDVDAIRFLVGDTNSDDELLSDSEIEWLLDQWLTRYDSVTYVAAVAAETIAGKFAREVTVSADGVSVGSSELQSKFEQLATSLRDQYKAEIVAGAPDAGGVLWGETYDTTIKPLSFSKGMHDNREAGMQDYGGTHVSEIPPEWIGT